MSTAKYHDNESYSKADSSSLLGYLQSNGYQLKKIGREYMLQDHDSLKINADKNCFVWNSQKKAGGPVQFVMYVENKTRDEAIEILLGGSYPTPSKPPTNNNTQLPRGELVLPEKNGDYKRIFAYLTKTRGIDSSTIKNFVSNGQLYESKEHHNCVFVAFDESGKPVNATMRGTTTDKPFKADVPNVDKTYPFSVQGDSNRLYVYESAIDLMSDITIVKLKNLPQQNHHRISLGGVYDAPLLRYLEQNPQINTVVFRTDNDQAGKNAVRIIGGELLSRGLMVKAIFPLSKDVNQDLLDFRAKERALVEVEL